MERVAVDRELGSGQGDIMTRIPNSNHLAWFCVAFVIWYWF